MNCIQTSLFDIFKVGPGPSSSHTIGPMKAGGDFLKRLAELPADKLDRAHHIEAELFGSLALTGKGHGTDRAVGMGLLGENPETCPVERTVRHVFRPGNGIHGALCRADSGFLQKVHPLQYREKSFSYSNTLVFHLFSEENESLAEETYYSSGRIHPAGRRYAAGSQSGAVPLPQFRFFCTADRKIRDVPAGSDPCQ